MKYSFFDRMGGYVRAHTDRAPSGESRARAAVTISRQAGAGGMSVAHRLATYLEDHQRGITAPWEVYDQNALVEAALEKHRLPAHYAQYLPEDSAPFLHDTIEDLLGLHPAAGELVRHLAETMLGLARRGNVILVGRGGNRVAAQLPHVVHARLVAPRAVRVRRVEVSCQLSAAAAADFVARTDRARHRFLRQNFGPGADDPSAYDITLNTARLGLDLSARMLGELVLDRMASSPKADDEALLVAHRLSEL